MNVLLVDGVKYYLWTPEKEEEEFHPMIKEHSKEIFGKNSLYLPIEEFLISEAGRGAMPDGFAIVFSDKPKMYIVEVELSSHDLDKHIIEQINRFFRAIKNPENRKRLADDLERKIRSHPLDEAFVRQEIGTKELYKFLSDLVSQLPEVVIIIEEKNDKLIEAFANFIMVPIIKEFKTYVRENAPAVHAHLFEPVYDFTESSATSMIKTAIQVERSSKQVREVKVGDVLELVQRSLNERKYRLFRLTGDSRWFFPGYKVDFFLETDIGEIKTKVVSSMEGTKIGDPTAGNYISGNLKPWYNRHSEVTVGTKLRFECVEPYKRYRLTII